MTDSWITNNRAEAVGGHSATVTGAGVFNNGTVTFEDVGVSGNSGAAFGPTGAAQGGGIWNGVDLSGGTSVRVRHEHLTGQVRVAERGDDGRRVPPGRESGCGCCRAAARPA